MGKGSGDSRSPSVPVRCRGKASNQKADGTPEKRNLEPTIGSTVPGNNGKKSRF